LRQCNASSLEKQILDCGAGGREPPLALFYQYGYQTYGIEIAEEALSEATRFCRERAMHLNIFRGDMRHIPFTSESFSFVYAFNSIMFMTKPDVALSMGEIERVLKPGGLVYVNFVSVDEPDKGPFCETAPARELLKSERFAQHKDRTRCVFRRLDRGTEAEKVRRQAPRQQKIAPGVHRVYCQEETRRGSLWKPWRYRV
jgi:ubiquinone/menaquinone biosynthesis C-methylase UbiE